MDENINLISRFLFIIKVGVIAEIATRQVTKRSGVFLHLTWRESRRPVALGTSGERERETKTERREYFVYIYDSCGREAQLVPLKGLLGQLLIEGMSIREKKTVDRLASRGRGRRPSETGSFLSSRASQPYRVKRCERARFSTTNERRDNQSLTKTS